MWEYADAHRLPILIHTRASPYDAPKVLTDIAPAYPRATFLLGHSGGSDLAAAVTLAEENPNVYLEWCGSWCDSVPWQDVLARLGPKRLVFGTDAVFLNPAWELGRLLSQDIPDEQLVPILGGNMRDILARRKLGVPA